MKTKLKNELTPFHDYLSQTENTIVLDFKVPGSSDTLKLQYDYQTFQLRILNTISHSWIVIAKIVKWNNYNEPCVTYNVVFTLPAKEDAYINAEDITIPNAILRIDAVEKGCVFEDLSLVCEEIGISLHFNASLIYQPDYLNVLELDGNELNIPI